MVELERRRAMQAAHERRDARAVARLQLPRARAVDRLDRELRRQLVDALMQVHDQQVHAVVDAVALALDERFDLRVAQPVGRQRTEPLEPVARPRVHRVVGGRFLQQRPRHRGELAGDLLGETSSVRDQHLVLAASRAGDEILQPGVARAGALDLVAEIGRRPLRLERVRCGGLNDREADLDAVVGRERALEEGREHQPVLAERVEGVDLLHGGARARR